MKRTFATLMVAILVNLPTVLVQAQEGWERILIPLYTEAPIEGSHDSLWTTELSVLVQGQQAVVIAGYEYPHCGLGLCQVPAVPPGRIFYPSLGGTKLDGAYLPVEKERAENVQVQLRARDLSRQAEDWGAEIPTISESAAPVGGFDILDLPADHRYRVMLRIYHFEEGDIPVTVRVYEANPQQKRADDSPPPDTLLAEYQVDVGGGTFAKPGYGAVPTLTLPPGFDAERYRISVEADADVRLWGFATITNNDTQHVTVASPHR
jgi:hypothetical protein